MGGGRCASANRRDFCFVLVGFLAEMEDGGAGAVGRWGVDDASMVWKDWKDGRDATQERVRCEGIGNGMCGRAVIATEPVLTLYRARELGVGDGAK